LIAEKTAAYEELKNAFKPYAHAEVGFEVYIQDPNVVPAWLAAEDACNRLVRLISLPDVDELLGIKKR
jgi:hypothetical protein